MRKAEITSSVDLTRERQGFVDARQRAVRTERLRLQFREQNGSKPIIAHALIDPVGQHPAKVRCALFGVMKTTACPTCVLCAEGPPERHPVFQTKIRERLCRDQGCGGVAA